MTETQEYIAFRYEAEGNSDGSANVVEIVIDDPYMRQVIKTYKGRHAFKKAQNTASAYRMEQNRRVSRGIVERGLCPTCGGALKINLALSGWYQCEQFGSDRFRKDPTKPSCNFQCFI